MPRHVTLLLLLLLISATGRAADAPDLGRPGPHEVRSLDFAWKDGKRDREVPARVYAPASGPGPFPVIIFSHGLGGLREGYAYLGRHWASHGFVSVHVQHKGSDDAVWKGSDNPLDVLRKAAREPGNAVQRPLDVRFALDEVTRLNDGDGPLRGRLDLARVGMAGHSFGAYTTQMVIGQVTVVLGKEVQQADKRVKAAIAMSPNPPAARTRPEVAYAKITVPCLHLTGTRDNGVAITETKPEDRRVPFDNMKAANQYLVTFTNGDHMVFSGRARKPGSEEEKKDALFQAHIRAVSTGFWKAHLLGDREARAWLADGAFEKALGKDGKFEKK